MAESTARLPLGDPATVRLADQLGLAQVGLRGRPDDPKFVEAVEAALGVGPPLVANAVARRNQLRILWLGPDEWLVVDDRGDSAALMSALSDALAGRHVSIVDLSDARTVLDLAGPQARAVLEKGCPLDLHPRRFTPGRCAGTIIAQTQTYLEQIDDSPSYRLYVRPSFARHMTIWLIDAMAEFVF